MLVDVVFVEKGFSGIVGKEVLVVEEEPRSLSAVSSGFERLQMVVGPATSAQEAFALLRHHARTHRTRLTDTARQVLQNTDDPELLPRRDQ